MNNGKYLYLCGDGKTASKKIKDMYDKVYELRIKISEQIIIESGLIPYLKKNKLKILYRMCAPFTITDGVYHDDDYFDCHEYLDVVCDGYNEIGGYVDLWDKKMLEEEWKEILTSLVDMTRDDHSMSLFDDVDEVIMHGFYNKKFNKYIIG
jgi:hypothetical protein